MPVSTLGRYLARHRARYAAGVLLLLATNACALLIPWVTKDVVDALGGAGRSAATRQTVAVGALLVVALALLQALVRTASRLVLLGAGQRVETAIRADLFDAFLRLEPGFYQTRRTGDLMSRATNDLQSVSMLVGFGLLSLVNTVIVYAGTLVVMLRIDPWLTLAALAPYPLLLGVARRYNTLAHAEAVAVQEQLARLANKTQENLSGMPVVRAYTLAPREVAEFGRLNEEHLARVLRQTRTHGIFSPLLSIMTGIGALAVLWIGGRAVLEGRLSLGVLVAFTGYVAYLAWPTMALGWVLAIVRRGFAAFDRVTEILATPSGILDGPEAAPLGGPVRGEIEIRRLTFRYEADRPPALRDVSLRIAAGTSVAVVGPTGSGKTTLATLLPRLWDPPHGTVFIDGREIHTIPLRDLRAAIGFVPQEAFLFSRTLRENVAFGASETGVADRGGGGGPLGRRGAAVDRVGHGGRRARPDALGRSAPAGDPGACPPARPPDTRSRRRFRRRRRRDRGRDPRRPPRPHPRAHHAGHHPPSPRRRACSIASSSWTRAASWRRAPTRSSSPAGGSTRACGGASSSRRRSRPPDEVDPPRGMAVSPRPAGPWEDDDTAGRVYDARLAGRVWAFTRPYRGAIALSAALFPLLAAVDLVQPYLVKVAIDEHILQGDWPGLSRIVGLFSVTLAVQYALRYAQIYLATWTGQRVVHDLRAALFAHVQRLPAAFFDRNPVGRVMTRVLGDVEAIGEVFTAGAVAILGDVITLVGVIAVMLLLHFRLTVIIFTVLPLLVGAAMAIRKPVRRAYREVRTRLAQLNAELQETISGMAVIQLFGREAARSGELRELGDRYRRAQFRRMGFDTSLYAVAEAVGAIVVAALLWWGGIEILDGTLTFGVLVAFMQYTQRFYLPIRDASAKFSVMQAATVSAERVFALLDTPPEVGGTAVPAVEAEAAPSSAPGGPDTPGTPGTSGTSRASRRRPGPRVPGRLVRLSGGRGERAGAWQPGRKRGAGLGPPRRVPSRRDRRADRRRRQHGCGEDDSRPAPHANVRRPAGGGAGRGRGRPGVGPDRAPAARRPRPPGRRALRGHRRGEPRPRARSAAGDGGGRGAPRARGRVHPVARRRLRGSAARARREPLARTAPAPFGRPGPLV